MSKEEQKKEINNSKSATVLKTIYTILILLITINCIILILSIIYKSKIKPITSEKKLVFLDNSNPEVDQNIVDQNIVDQNIVDQNMIDQNIVDENINI